MANIIPQGGRLLGSIIPDITIEESTNDSWEITSFPVQQGASISDHKYRKPIALKMSMMFKGDSPSDLGLIYQKLLALQADTNLFSVTTPKRIYNNMQILSLACTTDQRTENVLSIIGELREVNIKDVVVSNVPARAKQKKAGKTGGTANAGAKKPAVKVTAPTDNDSAPKQIAKALGIKIPTTGF